MTFDSCSSFDFAILSDAEILLPMENYWVSDNIAKWDGDQEPKVVWILVSALHLYKMRVPIGYLGVIHVKYLVRNFHDFLSVYSAVSHIA